MSNQFQSRPKKDNEAAMRHFIDKLFGDNATSFEEAGISDAKEAFHSAQSILRAANVKSIDGNPGITGTNENFHAAQSILHTANANSTKSNTVSCSKEQSRETKHK